MFPGENISDKNCVTEQNEILLNSMPNSWSNRRMYNYLIVNILLLNELLTCLKAWNFQNLFTKV